MREWLLLLVPVVLIFYFVAFPGQFEPALDWLGGLIFTR